MDENTVIESSAAAATLALLIISIGFILFIYFFHLAKRKNLLEKQQRELAFVQQLRTIQSEIKQETLQYISRELHDNIGQLLTLQKMHVSALIKTNPNEDFGELHEVVMKTIQETKGLTSSLLSFADESSGLEEMIRQEVNRINQVLGLSVSFHLTGKSYPMNSDHVLVIFRMVQEFLNNSMKHSQGDAYTIKLLYLDEGLSLRLNDNGVGFDTEFIKEGNGLRHLRERVKILGGQMRLSSVKGEGTSLDINIKRA